MPKSKTPTAVRVARWTAIAAAVTALGSTINTMWEKKPWFLGGDETPAPIVAPASAPAPTKLYIAPAPHNKPVYHTKPAIEHMVSEAGSGVANVASVPAADNPPVMMTTTAMEIKPTLYDRFMNFVKRNPIAFWLIFISAMVMGVYPLIEYFNHRHVKRMEREEATSYDQPRE